METNEPDVKTQEAASSNGSKNSTPSEQSSNAPGSLAAVVAETAKASTATGTEGLEGGGVEPSADNQKVTDNQLDDPTRGVQLLDTAEEGEQKEETSPDDGSAEVPETPTVTPKPVDDATLPFGKHPRFQEVLKQKSAAESRVKELEPVVEAHNSVVQYCLVNNISAQQYREGLDLMALLNTDPVSAHAKLKEIMDVIQPLTGDTVTSKDLLEDMEKGGLTPERALEIERLRAGQKAQGVKQQLTQRNGEAASVRDRTNAMLAWDNTTRAKDPSFKPKAASTDVDGLYEYTVNKARGLVQAVPPRTTAEALAHCDMAYKEAQRFFNALRPRVAATKRTPSSTASSSANNLNEPKTLRDVIAAAANGSARRR